MIKKLDKKQTKRVHELCREIADITGNAFISCSYKPKDNPKMVGSIGCIVGEALEIGANLSCVLSEDDNRGVYEVLKAGIEVLEKEKKEKFSIKKEI